MTKETKRAATETLTALAQANGNTLCSSQLDRLLRLSDVLAMVGLSRTDWYRRIRNGMAPKPLKLGSASRWRLTEIEAWMASLPRAK